MGPTTISGESILLLMLIAFGAIWVILHLLARSLERSRALQALREEVNRLAVEHEAGQPTAPSDDQPLRAAA